MKISELGVGDAGQEVTSQRKFVVTEKDFIHKTSTIAYVSGYIEMVGWYGLNDVGCKKIGKGKVKIIVTIKE